MVDWVQAILINNWLDRRSMSISRCRNKYIYGLIWNGAEILEDQIGACQYLMMGIKRKPYIK